MDTPTPEYLTTQELAELLRIKERKVYDLAASGAVPCTRVVGKLLFPRQEIQVWLDAARSGPMDNTPLPPIFCGSHDPLLEWALRQSGCGLAAFFDGSLDGLNRVHARQAVACGMHIREGENWNLDTIQKTMGAKPYVVVEFAKRARGLVVSAGNPLQIKTMADLRNHRVARRQKMAASEVLFEQMAEQAGLQPNQLAGPSSPALTEDELARLVQTGKADAAFGLAAVANGSGLDYVPIIEERFDLLVWRSAWFDPPFQTLLNFMKGPAIAERASEMTGYDLSNLGTIHLNGPI